VSPHKHEFVRRNIRVVSDVPYYVVECAVKGCTAWQCNFVAVAR
jgi:hypothetical protein